MSNEKILESDSSAPVEDLSTGSLLYKAIVDFKDKYAWDKSLICSNSAQASRAVASDYVHEADYLERFALAQAATLERASAQD